MTAWGKRPALTGALTKASNAALASALAAVAAVALAACSGSDSDGESAANPSASQADADTPGAVDTAVPSFGAQRANPCAVVSRADVAAAFGGTAGQGTALTGEASGPMCQFRVTKSNLGVDGLVVVELTRGAQSAAKFAVAKGTVTGAESLTGVGEDAFYAANTVQFVKGGAAAGVQAQFAGAPSGKVRADTLALAKTVAARL